MEKTSALIVNHNDGTKCQQCLASLEQGLYSPEEYIVVNNGKEDDELAAAVRAMPGGKYVELKENRGFGAAINRAADHASGKYLLIANPDMTFEQQCLRTLVDYLVHNDRVGITAPLIRYPNGTLQPNARRFPSMRTFFFHRTSLLSRLFPGNSMTRAYLEGAESLEEPCPVDWLAGCCLLVQRQLFDAIGGFDERYFLFMEDVDFCKRTWQTGNWQVVFNPQATAVHDLGISNQLNRTIIRHRHASIRTYIRTHFGSYSWPLRKLALLAAWGREKLLLMRAGPKGSGSTPGR